MYHAGTAAVHTTTALLEVGVATAEHVGSAAMSGAAHLADGAEHKAGKILSHLNPLT